MSRFRHGVPVHETGGLQSHARACAFYLRRPVEEPLQLLGQVGAVAGLKTMAHAIDSLYVLGRVAHQQAVVVTQSL